MAELNNESIQLFEDTQIRTAWDEENEEWYFSIVDVVGILTEQTTYDGARNYWRVLKNRLKDEGSQLVTDCNQLKLQSPKDGKRYATDVANTEQLLLALTHPRSFAARERTKALRDARRPGDSASRASGWAVR